MEKTSILHILITTCLFSACLTLQEVEKSVGFTAVNASFTLLWIMGFTKRIIAPISEHLEGWCMQIVDYYTDYAEIASDWCKHYFININVRESNWSLLNEWTQKFISTLNNDSRLGPEHSVKNALKTQPTTEQQQTSGFKWKKWELPEAVLPVDRHIHLVDPALRNSPGGYQQTHSCRSTTGVISTALNKFCWKK